MPPPELDSAPPRALDAEPPAEGSAADAPPAALEPDGFEPLAFPDPEAESPPDRLEAAGAVAAASDAAAWPLLPSCERPWTPAFP